MDQNENNKLAVTTPPAEGTSLAERRKIGGSKLHQRVAAQPLPPVLVAQPGLAQRQKPDTRNPFDASLEMPNRIGMMLDCSSSMCEHAGDGAATKSKIEHLREACLDFLRSCDFSNTAIAIETFPSGSGGDFEDEEDFYRPNKPDPNDPLAHLLPQAPPPALGGRRGRGKGAARRGLCNIEAFLQADIDSLKACGGTPMAGAMQRCLQSNALTRGIIVSDGEADSSSAALANAAQWRDATVPVDCVHIGLSSSGEELLKQIAELTGGMYIKFDNVQNFTKAFKFLTPAYRAMLTSGSAGMLGAKEVK